MFGGSASVGAVLAQIAGSRGDDRPEKWTEERLDLEIQSEIERLGLARNLGRLIGAGSSLAIGKYLGIGA